MFKISRNKIYFLGLICAFVMCISGIYAFTNLSIVSVENQMNTGAINIELKQYSINQNGKEVLYNGSEKEVLPGEVISLIPRITNLGDDCYIRAKISYTDTNNQLVSAEKNIERTTKDWIKCGDYWYYKLIIKSGENLDLFKSFKIPVDISNKYQGKAIYLNITTEAVQAKNFEPNFDSVSPWDDVIAKKATKDNFQTDKVQLNTNVKIEYENNADLYINVPDTFFGKLNYIFPGDVITEYVTIENSTSNEIEYFISTDKLFSDSEKTIELLDKLNLTIKIDEKSIYDGKILNIEKLSLGKFKENASAKVKFIITIPKNLENEYSALNATIKWVFSVNGEEKVVTPEEKPKDEVIEGPQTGDVKTVIVFTIFFISAIGLIISLILDKKSKKDNR